MLPDFADGTQLPLLKFTEFIRAVWLVRLPQQLLQDISIGVLGALHNVLDVTTSVLQVTT